MPTAAGRLPPKVPLVLEDNLIIAMEVEELLLDLGFPPAQICGSIPNALQILEKEKIGFAVLDIYLGTGETCLKLADALSARETPFIFVSGYDGHSTVTERFPHVPVIAKPFLPRDIEIALKQISVI